MTKSSSKPGEWADLTDLLRQFQTVSHQPTVKALGRHHNVVITVAGAVGDQLLKLMDGHPGGCGPVIGERRRPWLYWVVPAGTAERWDNSFAACLGAPWKIPWPPMHHENPPGPHWVRPFRVNQCVGPGLLSDALNEVRPGLTPYKALGTLLGLPSA